MGVAIVLLLYSGYQGWDELAGSSFRMDWLALLVSFLAYGPTILTTVWGWHTILVDLGGRISYWKNVKLYCSTNLARRLPTILFYAAGRTYVYQQENTSALLVSTAIFLELVMVAGSGLVVTFLFWPFMGSQSLPLPTLVILGIGVVLLAIIFIRHDLLVRSLNKLSSRFLKTPLPVMKRRDLARWIAIYSVNWVLGGTCLFFLVQTFYPVPLTAWPKIVAIWSLSGLVSTIVTLFVPAGFGTREVTMAYLLQFLVPLPISIAVSALSRVWVVINQLLWFAFSFFLS